MSVTIDRIEFYVRETKPARFASALGEAARSGAPPQRVTSPLCHARMTLRDASGGTTFGCSADRLSVRWLDKRPGRDEQLKHRELVRLIQHAGEIYLSRPTFETPFEQWQSCHPLIMQAGRAAEQEDLTSSFASALLERALIDGMCRLANRSLFDMLQSDGLGIRPEEVHAILRGVEVKEFLPPRPVTAIHVRHTVGWFDPLTDEQPPVQDRLDDGLPETLEDYIRDDGIRYFKVKISGDIEADLQRLRHLWDVMQTASMPVLTLDANEAYTDLEAFATFTKRLEREQLGVFQHILYIEQPLPRELALDPKAGKWIRQIAESKPIIIDESDGTLDAFRRAYDLGYAGTSHKNCKGFFKSLLNLGLCHKFAESGRQAVLSGEDLQNLPVVPLQQDLVSVGILGLDHCERNGHHYNYGLSMLSELDKKNATSRHADLYERRGDEWFLKIRDGMIHCASLHDVGFGVLDEPDWESMEKLDDWLARR